MTPAEIDRVVKIATTYKKAGQFRAYWANFNESVNLMASKEVVVESMWSPAVALLVAQGINVKYAAPPTGFRGWCSAQGIASHVASDPAKLQACYDYMNWMYSGWLGATIMRQGYYIGNGNSLLNWIKTNGASQAGRGHPVQGGRVRLLVRRRPRRTRPARHHRQGRRHQEGLGPRRWLASSSASATTRRGTATSRTTRTRSSGGTTSSAPRTGWLRGSQIRTRRGRHRPPPPRLSELRARPDRAHEGLPRRHRRRRRRQPARRPRRVRRPARPVRLRQDDDAADDRRPRVPVRGRHRPRRPVARRPAAAQAPDDDRLPALRALPAPLACSTTSRSG